MRATQPRPSVLRLLAAAIGAWALASAGAPAGAFAPGAGAETAAANFRAVAGPLNFSAAPIAAAPSLPLSQQLSERPGPSPEKLMGQTTSTVYDRVLTESLSVVWQTRERVARGEAPYLSQYFLNPHLALNDVGRVLRLLLVICVLRFLLAGAYHPRTRHLPCAFKIIFGPVARPRKLAKLAENAWYSLWHTTSFVLGVRALISEGGTDASPGWSRLLVQTGDIRWFWLPTPAEVEAGGRGWPLFDLNPAMRGYYLLATAFWLSCAVFLILEVQRDDFYAMALHHVVTCVLVIVSYTLSFWRLGSVILLTHDFADILLYTAKTVHYTYTPSLATDVLFVLFVVGFFASRLVFFPLFCVRPVLHASNLIKWSSGHVRGHGDIPGAVALPAFLCVLQVLHIFWFGLIVRMIRRTLSGRHVSDDGDIRSDDGGREDGDEKPPSAAEDEDTQAGVADAAFDTARQPREPPRPAAGRRRSARRRAGPAAAAPNGRKRGQ